MVFDELLKKGYRNKVKIKCYSSLYSGNRNFILLCLLIKLSKSLFSRDNWIVQSQWSSIYVLQDLNRSCHSTPFQAFCIISKIRRGML